MRGDRGHRIVDRIPYLSEVRRLRAEPVAVVDVYFKRKLPNIPKEHVGLSWSGYNLTFLDLSQLWLDDPNMEGITALVLAASDSYALTTADPYGDAHLMIQRLHQYLPVFDPGSYWGDEDSDIDWSKSAPRTNQTNKLFINQVGSGQWRPFTSHDELPQILFAGDSVPTDVSMATVEAAVISGIMAAKALWERRPLGPPVEIAPVPKHSDTAFQAMKFWLTPSAYWMKWWSEAINAVPHLARGNLRKGVLEPAATMLSLPNAFVGEWVQTAMRFWERVLFDRRK